MPLTRREFLTKLATIAVVAPLVPKILESATVPPIPYTPVGQPLTLAMLEEAYQTVCFGYDEPDLMIMAPDTYVEFQVLVHDLNERLGRPTWVMYNPEKEQYCPIFNNASITFSKELPKGSWININSAEGKQHAKHLHGLFSKDNLDWKPIPDSWDLFPQREGAEL